MKLDLVSPIQDNSSWARLYYWVCVSACICVCGYHSANLPKTIYNLTGKKTFSPWKKSYDKLRQHIKKQTPYFANKCPPGQSCGFSSGHVWMWELDYKESWVLKNWRFWTVVLKKTLESPLHRKVIQPVHPKENQSWIFNGRTDVEAETPILWSRDVKSWLIWKDPDAGKDWRS